MLYKFKSRVWGDLIMLEPNGRQALEIIGKEPGARGIIQWQQMPQAVAALHKAIEEDEARREQELEAARAEGHELAVDEVVSLRRRLVPMIEMFQHCHQAEADVVWGV